MWDSCWMTCLVKARVGARPETRDTRRLAIPTLLGTFSDDDISSRAMWGWGLHAQSNELTRGPPVLVQHFRLQGEYTLAQERCMSQILYMVWLHPSPIPVGRRGVISLFKWFLHAVATCRGGGVGTLWLHASPFDATPPRPLHPLPCKTS